MSNVLVTVDQIDRALPKQFRGKVTQTMLDTLNSTITDPIFRESYRDNLLSYVNVLQDGKFKIEQYLKAVRYCSHKLAGDSNITAYVKTWPDRYQYFVDNETSEKDIASYVTSYNKSKLVNLIMEQSLIPHHILNQDLYQKALNVQVELMRSAKSEKVRSDAANSILTHLKPPETKKVELDMTIKEDKSLEDLRAATLNLVAEQKKTIQAGAGTARDIAHSQIITAEAEVVDVN